jgi:hypothetical protein
MIKKHLAFLNSLDFSECKTTIEASAILGNSVVIGYISLTNNRTVEVSFTGAQNDRSATASIFVANIKNERYSVSDWISQQHIEPKICLTAKSASEPDESFIERFCSEFKTLCLGPLHNEITGQTRTPATMDWKGYK